MKRVGLVGARGYTGAELLKLIAAHPQLELAFISSRERLGQSVDGFDLRYVDHDPQALAAIPVDAVLLAVPNGKAAMYAEAFSAAQPNAVIVDLSADHRFDERWVYGLPEHHREALRGALLISNPGCYATAMQLALVPLARAGWLDASFPPQCFGVSGYSGAGTTPSDKNNLELLRDNLMPYASIGHVHEREVSRQLGTAIEFMPNVAEFFSGISMTVNAHLNAPRTAAQVHELLTAAYADEPLLELTETAPWVRDIAGAHGARIGGIVVSENGRRVVIHSTLDNLLKGAATQAMQNINLALGHEELTGIPRFERTTK